MSGPCWKNTILNSFDLAWYSLLESQKPLGRYSRRVLMLYISFIMLISDICVRGIFPKYQRFGVVILGVHISDFIIRPFLFRVHATTDTQYVYVNQFHRNTRFRSSRMTVLMKYRVDRCHSDHQPCGDWCRYTLRWSTWDQIYELKRFLYTSEQDKKTTGATKKHFSELWNGRVRWILLTFCS